VRILGHSVVVELDPARSGHLAAQHLYRAGEEPVLRYHLERPLAVLHHAAVGRGEVADQLPVDGRLGPRPVQPADEASGVEQQPPVLVPAVGGGERERQARGFLHRYPPLDLVGIGDSALTMSAPLRSSSSSRMSSHPSCASMSSCSMAKWVACGSLSAAKYGSSNACGRKDDLDSTRMITPGVHRGEPGRAMPFQNDLWAPGQLPPYAGNAA